MTAALLRRREAAEPLDHDWEEIEMIFFFIGQPQAQTLQKIIIGYTHYRKIPFTKEWLKTWPQLKQDAKLIVQKSMIELAGPDDQGVCQPQIDSTTIALNGGDGSTL
ncbi:hypothetical protein AC578_890 [Pseudocercospora eumusae]|uniref:Uncharacterized protein n=1 Tax=Pseudocercospora eumusae TaxID=321146 RepID=A0A139H431_9PEZI|nr:hypothetical protein AC578_890 [Pseudocercospora eumusae]